MSNEKVDNNTSQEDTTITVKQFKEWAANIPEKYDKREVVIPGLGANSDGYNPLSLLNYHGTTVHNRFEPDPEGKGKHVLVIQVV